PSTVNFPCACSGPQCSNLCECMHGNAYYDQNGLLLPDYTGAIFECSYMCKCTQNCPNRVIQRGSLIDLKLTIFRTNWKGWGVRTEQLIRCGQYICLYIGELLTFQESETRKTPDMTYLFDLDKEVPTGEQPEYTIDARCYGNVSRFFNHSCNPNLTTYAAYVTHLNPMMPDLAFFATRDILPGEELTFDYQPQPASGKDVYCSRDKDDPNAYHFACHCGAKNCRGEVF
ncbi:hypothetical protein FBU59_004402, partial [Linderina macrospora]